MGIVLLALLGLGQAEEPRAWWPALSIGDVAFNKTVQRELGLGERDAERLERLREELSFARAATERLALSPQVLNPEKWRDPDLALAVSPADILERVRRILGSERYATAVRWRRWARGPGCLLDAPPAEPVNKPRRQQLELLLRPAQSETEPVTIAAGRQRCGPAILAALTPAEATALREYVGDDPPLSVQAALLATAPKEGPFPVVPLPQFFGLLDDGLISTALLQPAVAAALGLPEQNQDRLLKLWRGGIEAEQAFHRALSLLPQSDEPLQRQLSEQAAEFALPAKLALCKEMTALLKPEQADDALACLARIRLIGNVFNGSLGAELGMSRDQQKRYLEAVQGPLLAEHRKKYPTHIITNNKVEAAQFLAGLGKAPPAPPPDVAGGLAKLQSEIMTEKQRQRWQGWMERKVDPAVWEAMRKAYRPSGLKFPEMPSADWQTGRTDW